MGSVYGAHLQMQATEESWPTAIVAPSDSYLLQGKPDLHMPLDEKKRLRRRARALRRGEQNNLMAGVELADIFFSSMRDMEISSTNAVIAGYWPVGGEIDIRPLISRLHMSAHVCLLPVADMSDNSLSFKVWSPEDILEINAIGIPEPGPDAVERRPDVVLCPLLAFDDEGYRLGQGGGYYDRALKALRAAGKVLAVGMAYDIQRTAVLPRQEHDQPLDWLVSEKRVIRFERETR